MPRPELLRAFDRLTHRVLDRMGPTGLLDAPATSRVLESALLLTLLDREYLAHDHAALARDFIKTTLDTDPPDPLQRAFGVAALGETVDGTTVSEALSSFEHFSKGRKLLAFQTLLAELGAAEYPYDVPADAFAMEYQPRWLRLELSALKVLLIPAATTEEDWARLEPALRPGPVWQACHFARLVGLLALRKNPKYRSAVRRTLVQVAQEQLPGGGLPFITGLDVFATAIAGTALARIYPDDQRLAIMANAIASQQNPDGGFGFTAGVTQSDVDDTSYTIRFLRTLAPQRHARVITAAEQFLLAQQNLDGGFPTFFHAAPSEVAMTAGAVNALAPNPAYRVVAEQGVRFIIDAGPGIERSWSRNATNVLCRTSLALGTLAPDAPATLQSAARTAREHVWKYFADTQNVDGGWGHELGDTSDPISTAYAVIGLTAAHEYKASLDHAVNYLLARQQPDGGYISRPDQAGPRPLLYNTPALADVSVLLALSTASARFH